MEIAVTTEGGRARPRTGELRTDPFAGAGPASRVCKYTESRECGNTRMEISATTEMSGGDRETVCCESDFSRAPTRLIVSV